MPRTKKAAEVVEEIKEKAEEAVAAVETAVEEKKATRKKAPANPRTPRAAAPAVYVQFGENETDVAALIEAAKADYSVANSAAAKDIKLYIKPEDGMAYYVINGVEGKVAL